MEKSQREKNYILAIEIEMRKKAIIVNRKIFLHHYQMISSPI